MFGATKPATSTGGGFSFGAAAPASGASTGFSFGAAPATSTAPATGFGGFGAAPASGTAPATGFGGFGATPTQAAPASGFSGFGATPTPATPASGFSGFGATSTPAAPATGFGGFGATSTPAAPATGFSGFGATSTPATPATGFSGFGAASPATPATGFSGFGATPAAAPATGFSGFGAAPASTAPATGFSGFGGSGATSAMQVVPSASNSIIESLNAIKKSYQDPHQSRFKHMFYNIVDPSARHLYAKPANISDRLWKQAETDNPDPVNCVPAAVVGFQELKARIEYQQQYTLKFQTFVDGLRGTLTSMERAGRETDLRLEKCKSDHEALFHKLIKIVRKVEVYQCLGKPFHDQELKLRQALQKILHLLNRPTEFHAKVNDLISVQKVQEQYQSQHQLMLDEPNMVKIHQVLQQQNQGFQHLSQILTKDMRDLEIMKKGLSQKLRYHHPQQHVSFHHMNQH